MVNISEEELRKVNLIEVLLEDAEEKGNQINNLPDNAALLW
jgi:hypothetical protein